MSTPADDIVLIAHKIQIRSETEFEIDGVIQTGRARMSEADSLVQDICNALYSQLYCRRSSMTAFVLPDPLIARQFVMKLSGANSGQGTWDPSWSVVAIDKDGLHEVTKEGLALWVPPSQILSDHDVLPGCQVRIRVAKELRKVFPGFYMALGDAPLSITPEPLIRLYWHLTHKIADRAMALVTTTLNRLGIPFRFKILSDPSNYVRADAGVLLLERASYPDIRKELKELYQALRPSLRPEVPRFVKPLALGLGAAEDPQGGQSFGVHRCELIADALWSAWRGGCTHGVQQRVDTIRTAFLNAGLDPDRPYLGPSSPDIYSSLDDLL